MASEPDDEGAAKHGAGEWLALYGSLMREMPAASGAKRDLLDQLGVGSGLRRIGTCRIPGRLYDLGPYPALRAAHLATDVVCGELHAVLDPEIFSVLDSFEGFDPQDRLGSDYLREPISLLEPRGLSAWIYVYNRTPDPARRIASGDWRNHLAKRADPPHDPD